MYRPFKNLIYALIVILPFLLIFFKPPYFENIKTTIWEASSGPLYVMMAPVREVRKLVSYRQTHRDYQRLKSEVGALRSRLVGLEEVVRENTRYEQLLQFKRSLVYSSVAARVIGRNPTSWNTTMMIDRGSSDGLEAGMPVVTSLGVVGKVAEVSDRQSKVILITDPGFKVGALLQNSRHTGMLTGTLRGFCRLKYLPEEADINIGDNVLTAKLSGSFPEGLILGRVASALSGREYPTAEAIVEPVFDLTTVEEVLVIKGK